MLFCRCRRVCQLLVHRGLPPIPEVLCAASRWVYTDPLACGHRCGILHLVLRFLAARHQPGGQHHGNAPCELHHSTDLPGRVVVANDACVRYQAFPRSVSRGVVPAITLLQSVCRVCLSDVAECNSDKQQSQRIASFAHSARGVACP